MRPAALLLLLAPLLPAAPTPAEAADEIAAVFKDPAALAKLAARRDPDLWAVAEHLAATGRKDAAVALAAAARGDDFAQLPAYVASDARAVSAIRRAHERVHALRKQRRFAEGMALCDRTIPVARKIGWRRRVHHLLNEAAVLARFSGDRARFQKYLERALALGRERKWEPSIASTLQDLGALHTESGNLERGRAYADEARRLFKKLDLEPSYMLATLNYANAIFGLGEVERARALLEEVRDYFIETKQADPLATVLLNLGRVYGRLGRSQDALAALEESAAIARRLDNAFLEGHALIGLAGAHGDRNRASAAAATYRRAAALLEKAGASGWAAQARASEAGELGRLGRHEEAEALLQLCLDRFEKLGWRLQAAETVTTLAALAMDTGRPDVASARAMDARDRFARLGRRPGPMLVRVMCVAACARKEFEPAERLARDAWEGSVTPDDRASYGETLASVLYEAGKYDEAIAVARATVADALEMAAGWSDEGAAGARQQRAHLFDVAVLAANKALRREDVVYFIECRRAGALLEGLQARAALGGVLIPAPLRGAEQKARRAYKASLAAYERARTSRRRRAIREARTAVEKARAAYADAVERIQREAKRGAALTHPRPVTYAEMTKSLRPDQAFVWYTEITSHGGDSWGFALVFFRGALRAAVVDSPAKGDTPATLRRKLVDKLALPEPCRSVLVAPDGSFTFVPYCLLFGARDVTYVPSATTWLQLRAAAPKPGRGVLAVGDPVYETGGLARLPATRAEAKAVGDTVLLGGDATVARFKEALARRARWRAVHFACHGLIDERSPMFSSLALTGGNLTAYDLFRMRLPADLAVLSACETAKGKVYRIEGVVGLTRAFMFAGVPRVLVSLWKVDDDATQALMTRFYELLRAGRPTETALRLAQAHVASRAKWKDPKYWAAWQLWGRPG